MRTFPRYQPRREFAMGLRPTLFRGIVATHDARVIFHPRLNSVLLASCARCTGRDPTFQGTCCRGRDNRASIRAEVLLAVPTVEGPATKTQTRQETYFGL